MHRLHQPVQGATGLHLILAELALEIVSRQPKWSYGPAALCTAIFEKKGFEIEKYLAGFVCWLAESRQSFAQEYSILIEKPLLATSPSSEWTYL